MKLTELLKELTIGLTEEEAFNFQYTYCLAITAMIQGTCHLEDDMTMDEAKNMAKMVGLGITTGALARLEQCKHFAVIDEVRTFKLMEECLRIEGIIMDNIHTFCADRKYAC